MANKPMIGEYLSESLGNVPAAVTGERTIEVITQEILQLKAETGEKFIAIGQRLIEAKEKLSHGEWLPWLEENVEFSEKSAQDLMRIAREFSNPQALADLGKTKVLKLLLLPAAERDEFMETHDVQNMSTRELDDAIKRQRELEQERDEARKDAETARAEARTAEESRAKMESDMTLLKAQSELDHETSERLRARVKELEGAPKDVFLDEAAIKKAADEAREEMRQSMQRDLDEARDQAAAALAKIRSAATPSDAKPTNVERELCDFLAHEIDTLSNRMYRYLLKAENSSLKNGAYIRETFRTLADKFTAFSKFGAKNGETSCKME